MNFYFKKSVDLNAILKSFKFDGNTYRLQSPFYEFIEVDPKTREIIQNGYIGLVREWIKEGYITNFSEDNNENILVFPHTIENITFHTKQELIDYVTERIREINNKIKE